MRRLLGFPLVTLALVGLVACSTGSGGTPTPGPASSAGSTGSLDFAQVEQATAPAFRQDPLCRSGEWSENSTGVDEDFRPSVTFFRQFDCYQDDQRGGIPDRVQQSIYVEFSDPAVAEAYADSEGVLYAGLRDGPRVVVAGTGLDAVDMRAYLTGLQASCGCGELFGTGS